MMSIAPYIEPRIVCQTSESYFVKFPPTADLGNALSPVQLLVFIGDYVYALTPIGD
jgi:hypothetical protein